MDVLMGSFPKFSLKLFFEIPMDGCSKHSNNICSRTPMDASVWMKKDYIKMHRFPDGL